MICIKNGFVFHEGKGFIKADILVENRKIIRIAEGIKGSAFQTINAEGCLCLPGFIDIHTHGANGYDTMQATYEALEGMSVFFASKGVTSFLPATMTAFVTKTLKALENVKEAISKGTSGARILGVNLEGPFINSQFKGAQPQEHIILPSIETVESFIEKSGNNIKIIILAPELSGTNEVIKHFKDKNMVFCIGHSALNYEGALEVFQRGVTHVAHLFNAMPGIHHRDPGLAGAALDCETATVEIIADGIHLHPSIIRMVMKCKTSDKIVLITDSTMAAGLGQGEYFLGEQKIIVKDNTARLENGALSGSTLTMVDAVRNMVKHFNIPVEDAVKMATIVPARVIKVDNSKGSIENGKDADIVITDRDFRVKMTMVEGRVVYNRELGI